MVGEFEGVNLICITLTLGRRVQTRRDHAPDIQKSNEKGGNLTATPSKPRLNHPANLYSLSIVIWA